MITGPGDLVMIESPTYFPLFSALQRRHLRVIEIYSHPISGIDPDQFDFLIESNDIRACLLMPVNHFPTGVSYPEETLRRIAARAAERSVPIVEYDTFSELNHASSSPPSLKNFDDKDLVLQIGSFASTLGPLAGAGWVLNARFRERILEKLAFTDLAASEAALQHAITECMVRHSYDRQVRQMRELLKGRVRRGLQLVAEHFPRQCSVSRPAGGFMCWVRLPAGSDSLALAVGAADIGLSVVPGPLPSVASSFRNFIGLNFSYPWTNATEQRLAQIAELV